MTISKLKSDMLACSYLSRYYRGEYKHIYYGLSRSVAYLAYLQPYIDWAEEVLYYFVLFENYYDRYYSGLSFNRSCISWYVDNKTVTTNFIYDDEGNYLLLRRKFFWLQFYPADYCNMCFQGGGK